MATNLFTAPLSLLQKGSQIETPIYIKFPKTRCAIDLTVPDKSVLGSPRLVIYSLF